MWLARLTLRALNAIGYLAVSGTLIALVLGFLAWIFIC
jgi:hypothetical protein